MSYLRAQHVFYFLMAVSALTAFVIPPEYARRVSPQVQWVFAPVSRPVGALAASISDRVAPPAASDHRGEVAVKIENQRLRAEVALLTTQLDEMRRRDAELAKLGSAKDKCRIFPVVGGDSGTRESLALGGSSFQGLKDDQWVLYAGGLAGQVKRAGPAGAQVQLITDPGTRIKIRFVRFTTANGQTTFEPLGIPAVLAQGAGKNAMVVKALSLATIGYNPDGKALEGTSNETVREGTDYAVLFDSDCPRDLQGKMIGRVTRVIPRPDARLFAEIRIEPDERLAKLREVMVMTKENTVDE
ncbi:MAG TPA: rod shape-determining protein MreC [Tepidisphaeraceae bacterium]